MILIQRLKHKYRYSMEGVVYKSTGSWYTVKAFDGMYYECRIKGKFRTQGIKSTNPVVVGDYVYFELDAKGETHQGVIHQIHDRRNYIVRKSVNLSKRTHIIASNIDYAFLLITLNNPITHTTFIDRFLVTAYAYGVEVVLLFNKTDTYSSEQLLEVEYLKHIYQKIGYKCISISATKHKNIEAVKSLMKGKTSLVSGHSGVGKSTLINSISPSLSLKTAKLSEQYQQGQHTTTFAQMYDLDFDARIIDTPGVKGFGMIDMEKTEIANYFPEFFALKPKCKFNNCLHIDEPFCAVKTALDNDEIAWSRYKSYLQIMQGDEGNYRVDIYQK